METTISTFMAQFPNNVGSNHTSRKPLEKNKQFHFTYSNVSVAFFGMSNGIFTHI